MLRPMFKTLIVRKQFFGHNFLHYHLYQSLSPITNLVGLVLTALLEGTPLWSPILAWTGNQICGCLAEDLDAFLKKIKFHLYSNFLLCYIVQSMRLMVLDQQNQRIASLSYSKNLKKTKGFSWRFGGFNQRLFEFFSNVLQTLVIHEELVFLFLKITIVNLRTTLIVIKGIFHCCAYEYK